MFRVVVIGTGAIGLAVAYRTSKNRHGGSDDGRDLLPLGGVLSWILLWM